MRLSLLLLPLVLGCADRPEPGASRGTGLLAFDGPVPSNLLMLSIDTLRRDQLPTHGSTLELPFLEQLAAESVVLEDHVQCANWTTASTACTMTGSTNLDRGVAPLVGKGVPAVGNLPTWLGRAGFATAFATANSYFGPDVGVTVGFDAQEVLGSQSAVAVGRAGQELLAEARRGRPDDPWYLHLHFMEPHVLYRPNEDLLQPLDELGLEPWPDDLTQIDVMQEIWAEGTLSDPSEQAALEAHLWRLYHGEVRTLDHRMAFVWDELEAAGLLDDTLVVLWTDHGEQFWERGLHTHAYDLNAEENDAALWFWAKNLEPDRLDLPSHSTDLVPTLLALYGVDRPRAVTGRRLAKIRQGRARFASVNGKRGPKLSVLERGDKLTFDWSSGLLRRYDRDVDPAETQVLDPTTERGQELWCLLRPQVDEMVAALGEQPVWPASMAPCD